MALYRLAILVLYLLVLCRLAVLVLCLLVLCRLAILVLCLLVPGCLLVLPVITALSLCSCGCLPLLLVLYRLWILPGKVWCSHIAVIMFIRIHILLFVGVLFVHKSYPLS